MSHYDIHEFKEQDRRRRQIVKDIQNEIWEIVGKNPINKEKIKSECVLVIHQISYKQ
jgi:hypothetical protein